MTSQMTGAGQVLEISTQIPESDLILMFPFTYVNYRIMAALHDHPIYAVHRTLGFHPEVNMEALPSFKAFLEALGPVPEDTGHAH